ncbi:MAG: metallophosphoesterase [Polyangiales bacterium]
MPSIPSSRAEPRAPASSPAPPRGELDYLLLSDIHLGSDIVPHLRPWAARDWLAHEAEVDAQLEAMLAHHRATRTQGRPLCVVIAGDFLDFTGMSLAATSPLRTQPTWEERTYGLGSAADHAVRKMHAIGDRHPRVFRALAALLVEGNQLVVVHGNHDIELHWRAVRRALVQVVAAHAPAHARGDVATRIAFAPWFFAVEGLLYVEHGHHFDPMCSFGDPLSPTCPRDSRRIRGVPFSIMLRNVARPTRGLSTASYEHSSFGAYLGLLRKLGLAGSARIALRFARASWRLLDEWQAHALGECRRRVHAARVRRDRFAARASVPPERLHALQSLYAQPAASNLLFVTRSLYLDRVLAILTCAAMVAYAVLSGHDFGRLEGILFALSATLFAAYAVVGMDRQILPTRRMQESADDIAGMFGARWVVMGHTHQPGVHALEGERRYVNLGHWGEDDLPEERGGEASPCSYLHLRRVAEGDYRGDLMRWDRRLGPLPMPTPSTPRDASRGRRPGSRALGQLPA